MSHPRLLLAALVTAAVLIRPTAAAWGARSAAEGPYSDSDGENNARCAKLHNSHSPRGYRPRWRPMNADLPESFWSTPTGPRSYFRRAPEGISEDLWEFLGGEVQLFATLTGSDKIRKSYYVALRCQIFTNSSGSPEIDDEPNVGVVLIDQGNGPLVVSTPNSIPELNFLDTQFTPIVLGMTPGEPGSSVDPKPWQVRYFEDAPGAWVEDQFQDETTLLQDIALWSRQSAPQYEEVDGSAITEEQWLRLLPTRLYNEEQCRAYLNYEEEQSQVQSPQQLVGVSGIFSGRMCDLENNTWHVLRQLATESRVSENSVPSPLSVPEGVLLVAIPAVWELVTAVSLLLVRIVGGKTRRVSQKQKVSWIALEIGTLAVAMGEFGLLVRSTVDQLQDQPCWIGRWAGFKDAWVGDDLPTIFGNKSLILSSDGGPRTDVIAIECVDDPGTDMRWAITVGVVVVLHLCLLTLECTYFTIPNVRNVVDVSLSQSLGRLSSRRRPPAPGSEEEQPDDDRGGAGSGGGAGDGKPGQLQAGDDDIGGDASGSTRTNAAGPKVRRFIHFGSVRSLPPL